MNVPRSSTTILDLRDSPWVDGPGRTILDCAETIDSARYRIVVGAFDGGNPEGTAYEQEALHRDLTVARIRERRAFDMKVFRQIIMLGRQHHVSLLHTHDFRSNFFGLAATRVLRVPLVSTVHGWIANDVKGELKTRLDKLILRQADHVISVSEQTRKCLGRWATEQRCTVIANAVRTERYTPQPSPGVFRASNGIAQDDVLIANIGRLSAEKGQLTFLLAARDLVQRYGGVRFVLFGTGPDQAMLEQFVNDNAMDHRVIFAGYRERMETLYDEIDLVVQSSSTEGMPNVMLEALLMEVPVIATDVGGTAEIVVDGNTGVLVERGNHKAIVLSVEKFLENRPAFQLMARKGRQDVLVRFDHARRVERLGRVYDQVLQNRRRTA